MLPLHRAVELAAAVAREDDLPGTQVIVAARRIRLHQATTLPPAAAFNHVFSLFVWLWLVVNDHKFLVGTVFFSHTN